MTAELTPDDVAAISRFDPNPTPFRRAAARAVAMASRWLMMRANHVHIYGAARLHAARAIPRRGLLTFSNHVSLFDDPWLTACLAEPEWDSLRWIAADAHNFFGTPVRAAVFNGGKAVPLVRGAGIDQPGMHFLAERLKAGEWVHVFPEGGRTRDPQGHISLPLKAGMAWLIQQAAPLVLPMHHQGMEQILPLGARIPRTGQEVHVRFGPLIDTANGLAARNANLITEVTTEALLALQSEAIGKA